MRVLITSRITGATTSASVACVTRDMRAGRRGDVGHHAGRGEVKGVSASPRRPSPTALPSTRRLASGRPLSALKVAVRGFRQLRERRSTTASRSHLRALWRGIIQAVGLAPLAGRRPWSRGAESEVLLMRGGYRYPAENYRRRILNRLGPRATALGDWTRIHHLNPDDIAVLQQCDTEARIGIA